MSETGFQAVALKITIDQSNAPGRVEIGAVELAGLGDASLPAAVIETPPVEQPGASAGGASAESPAGFLWRLGGEKAFDAYAQFPGLWGLDSGKVLVFGPMGGGEPLVSFGERGKGDGQFGDFSPTHLAVGLDGRIYVHDHNVDNADKYYHRIQVFSPQGQWLQTIRFPDDFFTPGGMDVGPDGNLYVVGFIGSKVLQYSPDGDLLGELGKKAIRSVNGGPQGIALDEMGNIYLALWTGVLVKLDPQGNLLGQWGTQTKDGETPWLEGIFYQPTGIAVKPEGSQVYFTDTSSKFCFVTAFRFP